MSDLNKGLDLDVEIRISSDYDPGSDITTWTAYYRIGAGSRQMTSLNFVDAGEFIQRRLADLIKTHRSPRADQPGRGGV